MQKLLEALFAAGESLNDVHYENLGRIAAADTEVFWREVGGLLSWDTPFQAVRRGEGAQQRWFVGGAINYYENVFTATRLASRVEALVVLRQSGKRDVYTYRDLDTRVRRLSARLRERGVVPGQTILVCTPQREIQLLLSLAALAIGARFCCVFFRVPDHVVTTAARESGAEFVVYDPGQQSDARPDFASCTQVRQVVSGAELLSELETVPPDTSPGHVYQADEPTFFLLSSGTTGTPKVIATGHAGMVAAALVSYYLVAHVPGDTREYLGLDLAWGPAFILSVYAPLLVGKPIVLSEEFFTFENSALIQKLREENVAATTIPISAFENVQFIAAPLPLRKLFLTGMALRPATAENISRGIDPERLTTVYGYGSSELGGLALLSFAAGNPGQLPEVPLYPYPGVQPASSSEENLVLSNTIPSVCVDIPNNPVAYEQLWNTSGALVTSDRITVEEGNRYRLIGRSDAVVKVKGRLLDVSVVAEFLQKNIASEGVVIEQAGELYYCVVGTVDEALHAQVTALIEKQFGTYAIPRVVAVPTIPRTAGGKVDQASLRAQVAKIL